MRHIDLSGIWKVDIDAERRGLDIPVPGCWENVVAEKDISGPVRIYRSFEVPQAEGSALLFFGRVSYYCEIFVNGARAGEHEGLWDSFRVDVSPFVRRGGENLLELLVWKPGYSEKDRFPLRQVLSGFVPDVCCTFGGIWDDVSLEMADAASLYCVNAEGDADGRVTVRVQVANHTGAQIEAALRVCLTDAEGSDMENTLHSLVLQPGEQCVQAELKVETTVLWQPGNAYLYTCHVKLTGTDFEKAAKCSFGLRSIEAKGTQVLLNGAPVYLRGILHWGYYDDILIPNPSRAAINDEITKVQAFGFNMIKHCLYIPCEEYLQAADEAGLLLWIELPLWLPEVTSELSGRILREYPRILAQLAGHPSVVLLSLGCELDSGVDSEMLERMYHLARENSTALIRDNSGSGECYGGFQVDYADYFDYHFYADLQDIENLMETFTPGWRSQRPWLYGEFCDSDTLRSLAHIRRRKGVSKLWWEENSPVTNPVSSLKADFRLDSQCERFEKYGLGSNFELLEHLSIQHAMVHRKMTIEFTRAFPEICGYNITSIRDVPIATSGIFDDLGTPKFSMDEFACFNGDVVLTPAWDLGRVWVNADRVHNRERFNYFGGDMYSLHVLASNYCGEDLRDANVEWCLTYGNRVVASDEFVVSRSIARGDVIELCYITCTLPQVESPQTLTLNVMMRCGAVQTENNWPVFLYPKPVLPSGVAIYDPLHLMESGLLQLGVQRLADGELPPDGAVLATTLLTPQLRRWVMDGGKAFLLQRGEGFLPVSKVAFWREGAIWNCDHPLLYALEPCWMEDLRYFSLSTDTAIDTYGLNAEGIGGMVPVVRRVDCREFIVTDYLIELSMGSGSLIATTLRFEAGMGRQPRSFGDNKFALFLFDRIVRRLQAI